MELLVPMIFTSGLFFFVILIYGKEKVDFLILSIFAALIACVISIFFFQSTIDDILLTIEYKPLIFIISMQIIVQIAEKHRIFQFLAVKSIHLTNANPRKFFYMMCFISAISATVLEDVMIVMIYIPLVIRTARILKIDAVPFIYGIIISMIPGFLLTPFPSNNILIANAFHIPFFWFFSLFSPLFIILFVISTVLLDFFMIKRQSPPSEYLQKVLLEIMDPRLVIVNREKFQKNLIYIGIIIISFFFFPEPYLVALIGACFILLLERQTLAETLTKFDWKIVIFLTCLFVILGAMKISGVFRTIGSFIQTLTIENVLLEAIFILIISAVLSSFFNNTPTALIMIALIENLFETLPSFAVQTNLVLAAFIIGINLGNFFPQGSGANLLTLSIAREQQIAGINFKSMLKIIGPFTFIHIMIGIGYLLILSLIL
jgi:Na+/H+ antiporter NhaD/arsenite permease-like protein